MQHLEKYYKRLGLSVGADQQEVKKAYRKLVLIHHPDRNDGNEDEFLLINEAYEVITGKRKVVAPLYPKTNRTSNTTNKNEKSKEERVKEAQQRYKDQIYKEHIENERYFKNLTSGFKWKVIQFSAIIGVILAFLIVVEPFLPKHYEEDVVSKYSLRHFAGENQERVSLIETKKGNQYWIGNITYDIYYSYPEVFIERTWFLHNPMRIISDQNTKYSFYSIHYSIHSLRYLFALIFMIPLVPLVYKKKTYTFSFFHALSLYGVTGLIAYLLLTNERILHLLSLGYL